jgi:hypothetical protein
MIEITEHPWFVGCQFHPELKSRLLAPHPLFHSFIKAALGYRDSGSSAATSKGTRKPARKGKNETAPKKNADREVKDDLPSTNGDGRDSKAASIPKPETRRAARKRSSNINR